MKRKVRVPPAKQHQELKVQVDCTDVDDVVAEDIEETGRCSFKGTEKKRRKVVKKRRLQNQQQRHQGYRRHKTSPEQGKPSRTSRNPRHAGSREAHRQKKQNKSMFYVAFPWGTASRQGVVIYWESASTTFAKEQILQQFVKDDNPWFTGCLADRIGLECASCFETKKELIAEKIAREGELTWISLREEEIGEIEQLRVIPDFLEAHIEDWRIFRRVPELLVDAFTRHETVTQETEPAHSNE